MMQLTTLATNHDEVGIRVLTESTVSDGWFTAKEARTIAHALLNAADESETQFTTPERSTP